MSKTKDWDSKQYMKFERERTQPSVDLINRIDIAPTAVLDIGCGPGNSTKRLADRFEKADILGIDSSDNMLEKAKSSYPQLKFQKRVVPDELDGLGEFDLIFSNACLHWIADHKSLFPRIMDKLCRGGVLAVQMPLVQYADFYKTLDTLIKKGKWEKLGKIKNFHNLSPSETYDILSSVSREVNMWDTTYYHIVPSHDSVTEWYMGGADCVRILRHSMTVKRTSFYPIYRKR